ncbi:MULTISPECIES: replication-relaxation family protein [Bacillus]|uniref:replication-relaxation family protein n=1 Tax=Bacillus TaxID=1386 RepID=UPI001F59BA47|nr:MULTISPECIES: replication-relaxation family protein [unclassified Bacillus cereus group]
MILKPSTYEIAKELKNQDLDFLYNVYLLRCLTIRQAYKYFFSDTIDSFELFMETKFLDLIELEVIDCVEFNLTNQAVFLTSQGVEIVRYQFDLPTDILDPKRKIIKRGYYRAGELKMNPRLINHQIHLNQFVLDFKEKTQESDIKWRYFDEKYVSQYKNIRPDGLIQIFDTDFFLEMDMATESKKQLKEKWNHYRSFLQSSEYYYKDKDKKIIVLFLIDNTEKVESRKDLVRFTAVDSLLDGFDNEFELYIGTTKELLELMCNKLIPNLQHSNWRQEEVLRIIHEKHGFHFSNGEKLRKALHDTDYGFYIRKIKQDNNLLIENGRVQEFLFDDYTSQPLSILKKIAYHERNIASFHRRFGREIGYLILVKNEVEAFHDLEIANDLVGIKNIYFTTLERLNSKPLHEAVYQYDSLGNIHHFSNSGFQERVYESSLK